MNLIPWRGKRQDNASESLGPVSAIDNLRMEMDRLFNRFLPGFPGEGTGTNGGFGFIPSLEVSESDTEITVRAEVPGVDPKELSITVSGQLLTLSGEKRESVERKNENFYHSERRFGSFQRSVQLPTPVNSEKVTAEHKNGIVQIRLQKQKSSMPKRIPIQNLKD